VQADQQPPRTSTDTFCCWKPQNRVRCSASRPPFSLVITTGDGIGIGAISANRRSAATNRRSTVGSARSLSARWYRGVVLGRCLLGELGIGDADDQRHVDCERDARPRDAGGHSSTHPAAKNLTMRMCASHLVAHR
jgi:hypothetical protein